MVEDSVIAKGTFLNLTRDGEKLILHHREIRAKRDLPNMIRKRETFFWQTNLTNNSGHHWRICFVYPDTGLQFKQSSAYFSTKGNWDGKSCEVMSNQDRDCVIWRGRGERFERKCVEWNNETEVCVKRKPYKETCSITITKDVAVQMTNMSFDISDQSDRLIWRTRRVGSPGDLPPLLKSGDQFTWETQSVRKGRDGFHICFSRIYKHMPILDSSLYFRTTGDCFSISDAEHKRQCVLWRGRDSVANNAHYKGFCDVRMLKDASLHTLQDSNVTNIGFGIDKNYDRLLVRNMAVESPQRLPILLKSGDIFTFHSNHTTMERPEWNICFDITYKNMTIKEESRFLSATGDCFIVGDGDSDFSSRDCVLWRGLGKKHTYTASVEYEETCKITMHRQDSALRLGEEFNIDPKYDHLNMRGIEVEDLSDLPVLFRDGEVWAFSTNSTDTSRTGWEICFIDETNHTATRLTVNEQIFNFIGNVENMMSPEVFQFNITHPNAYEVDRKTPDLWFLSETAKNLADFGLRPRRFVVRLIARGFCHDISQPASIVFDGYSKIQLVLQEVKCPQRIEALQLNMANRLAGPANTSISCKVDGEVLTIYRNGPKECSEPGIIPKDADDDLIDRLTPHPDVYIHLVYSLNALNYRPKGEHYRNIIKHVKWQGQVGKRFYISTTTTTTTTPNFTATTWPLQVSKRHGPSTEPTLKNWDRPFQEGVPQERGCYDFTWEECCRFKDLRGKYLWQDCVRSTSAHSPFYGEVVCIPRCQAEGKCGGFNESSSEGSCPGDCEFYFDAFPKGTTSYCGSGNENKIVEIMNFNTRQPMWVCCGVNYAICAVNGTKYFSTEFEAREKCFLETHSPSSKPSAIPSTAPSVVPSCAPTSGPTRPSPSVSPSAKPSVRPSGKPSLPPTTPPSSPYPTNNPSVSPTALPSCRPSTSPTQLPTKGGGGTGHAPTVNPSVSPTALPSAKPSCSPTLPPTTPRPSANPSDTPSARPTKLPSASPSADPTTRIPSFPPSKPPTIPPTKNPSAVPPTKNPSVSPTPKSKVFMLTFVDDKAERRRLMNRNQEKEKAIDMYCKNNTEVHCEVVHVPRILMETVPGAPPRKYLMWLFFWGNVLEPNCKEKESKCMNGQNFTFTNDGTGMNAEFKARCERPNFEVWVCVEYQARTFLTPQERAMGLQPTGGHSLVLYLLEDADQHSGLVGELTDEDFSTSIQDLLQVLDHITQKMILITSGHYTAYVMSRLHTLHQSALTVMQPNDWDGNRTENQPYLWEAFDGSVFDPGKEAYHLASTINATLEECYAACGAGCMGFIRGKSGDRPQQVCLLRKEFSILSCNRNLTDIGYKVYYKRPAPIESYQQDIWARDPKHPGRYYKKRHYWGDPAADLVLGTVAVDFYTLRGDSNKKHAIIGLEPPWEHKLKPPPPDHKLKSPPPAYICANVDQLRNVTEEFDIQIFSMTYLKNITTLQNETHVMDIKPLMAMQANLTIASFSIDFTFLKKVKSLRNATFETNTTFLPCQNITFQCPNGSNLNKVTEGVNVTAFKAEWNASSLTNQTILVEVSVPVNLTELRCFHNKTATTTKLPKKPLKPERRIVPFNQGCHVIRWDQCCRYLDGRVHDPQYRGQICVRSKKPDEPFDGGVACQTFCLVAGTCGGPAHEVGEPEKIGDCKKRIKVPKGRGCNSLSWYECCQYVDGRENENFTGQTCVRSKSPDIPFDGENWCQPKCLVGGMCGGRNETATNLGSCAAGTSTGEGYLVYLFNASDANKTAMRRIFVETTTRVPSASPIGHVVFANTSQANYVLFQYEFLISLLSDILCAFFLLTAICLSSRQIWSFIDQKEIYYTLLHDDEEL